MSSTSDSEYISFRLNTAFLDGYKDRTPEWGFPIGGGNSLGELTFLMKYARRKDDGSKERWHEACQRVIEGMYSILKDHCSGNRTQWNEQKAQRSAQDAYERMFTFKWLPPGRGIWMMGTEFVNERKNSAPLQNCFTGNEKFITQEHGPTSFAETVGEIVNVWTHEGWKKADVLEFATQPVQRVTFAPALSTGRMVRSNHRVDVTVTPDHRWLLSDGRETTSLSVGDVVRSASPAWGDESKEYWEGVAHGLVFGDGVRITHRYANGDYGYELRACDDRTKNLLDDRSDMFDKINLGRPSANGDPICFKRTPKDLKALPIGEPTEYVAGFMRGWICADASQNPSGTWILASQYTGAYDWLKDNAASSGWIVTGHSLDRRETNFGPRANPLAKISLVEASKNLTWKVTTIETLPEEQPVYCAVVQDTAAFALASGIYTGNCAFVSTEKISTHSKVVATLPFVRLMEMSMLGVGVGFDTKGAGKITLTEPDADRKEFRTIPDTREGWYESVGDLLWTYFSGGPLIEFNYDQIRLAGELIKGFGGVAAGPGPLIRLHDSLRSLLDGREGEKFSSTDIVDVCNLIGKCVVSGNVRRSAELALGDADDEDFLDLKDYEVNPERMGADGWGHASNNSIAAHVGGNYDNLVDRIINNGEPGLVYLDIAREFGRLADPSNNKDHRVAGVNPCAEQTLESYECCTLVESFPTKHETLADYLKTLKIAYLYGKAVTLLPTHWPEVNEVMQRNRRIGCSVSGSAQFAEAHGWTTLREWLDSGYQEIIKRDHQYSEWLGVRESIKMTSVKPSGSVSLVAGVTPGVHWPTADIYIRRMRLSKGDPLVEVLLAAGYHVEPDVMNPKFDMVVELPTLGPDVRTERDVSVWEKTALAVLHQRYWADNAVSVTLTFSEAERDQIGAVIRAFEGQLKTLSFLPSFDVGAYAQMPYERIDTATYEAKVKKVKPLDWDRLYGGDSLDAVGEMYCSNDVCEIKQ